MSRFIYLIDHANTKKTINTLFTFGRSTIGYSDISPRVSRTHFEITPLPTNDHRSNNGEICAELTLKGRYLRLTSNSISRTYKIQGTKIYIKHNDTIHLVSPEWKNDQYSLTISDPIKQNTSQSQTRKRKRENNNNSIDISMDSNIMHSPNRKRGRYAINNGNIDDSIVFDYNTNNMNHSNINIHSNDINTPSPKHNNNNNNNNNANVSMSLSGLMTSGFDRTPSNNSNKSDSSIRSNSGSKYGLLNSFPMGSNDNISDNSVVIKRKLSDELNSDDDGYLDALLNSDNDNDININNNNEEKEMELKIENEKMINEIKIKQQMLFHQGKYHLAVQIIDCDRYKFDIWKSLKLIANILKQFMSIHTHPKLRIVVVITKQYNEYFYKTLMDEWGGNINEKSMSLELEDDNDIKYKFFEEEPRIIIYSGEWNDYIKLKENGLCCQYIMNFTFWNFHGKKGDKINKLIHSKCNNLSNLSIEKYKTAKRKCYCYSIEINKNNGCQLYNEQNIRNIIQIRAPNMNNKLNDFIPNEQNAYTQLNETYCKIFEEFYKLTQLPIPPKDPSIVKDAQNWDNKKLIKKENILLTQQRNSNAMSLSISDNISHNSALIDMEGKNDDQHLHFSLKSVPKYKMVGALDWPQSSGYWKNALDVYICDKKDRDNKWDKCIFYEDSEYIIIYDRYYKAKIHLLIMPKHKIKSVYDLDPFNNFHIDIIEGMIARAKWIKIGMLKRNKNINNIKYGFHCIPSMNQLHCHLISDDMESDNLKNKKHFHSFTSNYFIPAKVLLKVLKKDKRKFNVNKVYYNELLKQKLKCHFCGNHIKTMPALKNHIKQCQFGKKRKYKSNKNNNINFNNSFGNNNNSYDYMSDDEQNDSFAIVFEGDNP